jgi:GNAT superfamily N-acetyltransferase
MSEAATVRIVDRVATVAELRELARSVDWLDHYDWPSMGRALERSIAGVVAVDDDRVVGAARIVGDGVRYFYLQDVLVEPDHTDEGIASRMVQRLLDVVQATAPADPFIGLFSSPEARGVYESLGFAADDTMTGMHRA